MRQKVVIVVMNTFIRKGNFKVALIVIYDSSDIDRDQLGGLMADTDHTVKFIDDPLSLENIVPEAEVISGFITSPVTAEQMDLMPELRLIACRSTGFNHVDTVAAKERGVAVTYVPAYGDHTVAEYAFTLLLALSRKLLPTVKAVSDMDVEPLELVGIDLYQRTFGVIGAGRIGQTAAQIAVGFGMKVIAYDPYPNQEKADQIGFEFVDFETLIRESDVISLHVPFTGDNKYLIDKEEFDAMKEGVIVINTARGQLLNQGALIDALRSGKVAAAGLDVFEGEGLLDIDEEISLLKHPHSEEARTAFIEDTQITVLRSLPNVIVAPHNAFNTIEARYRINETTAQNMTRFWYGETPNAVPEGR